MSTDIYESETGVFTVTRACAICDDCRNSYRNGLPAPVYQLTGIHGHVTLCINCLLRVLNKARDINA